MLDNPYEHDFFVQWHLTERCNLRCSHCYQEGCVGGELTTAEALAFIGEAAESIAAWSRLYGISFTPSFNISGGEPLLRVDLFTLLEAMRERSIAVHLLTNGTLIDRRTAEWLQLAEVATVQVSLEGPEPIHDAIRGRGAFQDALAGIERLVAAGLKVTINMTISRLNAGMIQDMLKMATDLRVKRLGFSRLVPTGRGRNLLDETLTPAELADFYQQVFSLSDRGGPEPVTGDPLASQMGHPVPEDGGDIPRGGCAAGLSGLTVAADGKIMPCRRLPVVIGDIRKDSLREVWAGADVLNRLRDRQAYGARCRSCPRWAVCRGCRAIAYAHAGDFLADDPQCFLKYETPKVSS
jgi:AdoMet-dependent heme synthase